MIFKNRIFTHNSTYVVYTLLMSFSLLFFSCKNKTKINNTTVDFSYNKSGIITVPFKNGKPFIIDTGCERSHIFKNENKIKY